MTSEAYRSPASTEIQLQSVNYIKKQQLLLCASALSFTLEKNVETGKALDLSDAAEPHSAGENKDVFVIPTYNPGNLPTVTEEGAADEYEQRIRSEIISPNEIQVSDIGSLDEIKKMLRNVVVLPTEMPEMLKAGLKPCKGVLLFGPPGTGKTMLAKAIAHEVKATFINVSMSTITSRLAGDAEKYVRALFTTAAKFAPTIIFIDEADSMFRKRTSDDGQHDPMLIMMNEFRARWDGLTSKPGEQILVLATTNRPFDIDEAIIRRFQRKFVHCF